jgi:hypothetical protein
VVECLASLSIRLAEGPTQRVRGSEGEDVRKGGIPGRGRWGVVRRRGHVVRQSRRVGRRSRRRVVRRSRRVEELVLHDKVLHRGRLLHRRGRLHRGRVLRRRGRLHRGSVLRRRVGLRRGRLHHGRVLRRRVGLRRGRLLARNCHGFRV